MQAALFLMKTSVVSKVSVTALDNLIGDIHVLIENSVKTLQDSLGAILCERGVDFDSELTAVFQNPSISRPFQELHSFFLRKEYYAKEMGLLVSFNLSLPCNSPLAWYYVHCV